MGLSASDMVLIETYWNVKTKVIWKDHDPGLSINRNILECKGMSFTNCSGRIAVLIETYWNVKGEISEDSDEPHIVLIETYWNVKVLSAGGSGAQRWEKYSCLPVF